MADLMHPTVTTLRGAALAREVLSRITAEVQRGGKQWDQYDWGRLKRNHDSHHSYQVPAAEIANDCGTVACFAGHTVIAAGETLFVGSESYKIDGVINDNGYRRSVPERARELLGLTMQQGQVLFHASNTIDDLTAMVDMMEAGENIYDYNYPEE